MGGKGYSAATTIHILLDCNRDIKAFGFRNDEYLSTAVGPNNRKLINLVTGRPLQDHQYGGDDKYYFAASSHIATATKKHLPAGTDGALRRTLGCVRTVQFNCCKLLIVFQYLQSGLLGKHARKQKLRKVPMGEDELSDPEDTSELVLVAGMRREQTQRPRIDGSS